MVKTRGRSRSRSRSRSTSRKPKSRSRSRAVKPKKKSLYIDTKQDRNVEYKGKIIRKRIYQGRSPNGSVRHFHKTNTAAGVRFVKANIR